ncbi:MAG: ribbon-helix-helix domain-containing protein [Burkholderiales bacterium]|nr:ribbon-helix-helix domain-containing protein [Burkholderiales bacterium]MDP2399858.1 ribbon-helix-helix domain-containing protein [Burkholderiales bacterium]
MSETVALRLDTETRKRLDQLAKTTERSRSALAAEAVKQFLELNRLPPSARASSRRMPVSSSTMPG